MFQEEGRKRAHVGHIYIQAMMSKKQSLLVLFSQTFNFLKQYSLEKLKGIK